MMKAISALYLAAPAAAYWSTVGSGCCANMQGIPASHKSYDGHLNGDCLQLCQSKGAGLAVVFPTGWCTCLHDFSNSQCQPLCANQGCCGSTGAGVTTYMWNSQSASSLANPSDDCLTAVNKYRGQAGKAPVSSYCASSYQDLATQMATWDSTHGAHNYVNTKGWTGSCPGFTGLQLPANEEYQNEFGWNYDISAWTWDEVVECWFNEGPDGSSPGPATQHGCQPGQGQHGHYNALVSDTACVACGYGTGGSTNFMFTTNFCPQSAVSNVTLV